MVLVLNKMTLLLAMYDAIEQYLRSQSKKTSKSKKISEKTSIKDRTSHWCEVNYQRLSQSV